MSTPPKIPVDLSKSTAVVCENCKNQTFNQVMIMRHLSAILSPTGEAGNVPIPTFACNACGHINREFVPAFMRTEAPRNDTIVSSFESEPAVTAPKPSITIVK